MATNYFQASNYYLKASSGVQSFGTLGRYVGFPAAGGGLLFTPFTGAQPVANVTCNAIITVLPTGLVVPPGDYYTDRTVAQLITLANA